MPIVHRAPTSWGLTRDYSGLLGLRTFLISLQQMLHEIFTGFEHVPSTFYSVIRPNIAHKREGLNMYKYIYIYIHTAQGLEKELQQGIRAYSFMGSDSRPRDLSCTPQVPPERALTQTPGRI